MGNVGSRLAAACPPCCLAGDVVNRPLEVYISRLATEPLRISHHTLTRKNMEAAWQLLGRYKQKTGDEVFWHPRSFEKLLNGADVVLISVPDPKQLARVKLWAWRRHAEIVTKRPRWLSPQIGRSFKRAVRGLLQTGFAFDLWQV